MSGKRDEDGRSEKTFGETQDRSVRLQQSPVSAGVGHRQGRADSGSAPGLAVRHAMQTSGTGRVVAGRWIGIVAAMMASLDPGIMLTGPYRTGHLQQQTSCQQQPHNELHRYEPPIRWIRSVSYSRKQRYFPEIVRGIDMLPGEQGLSLQFARQCGIHRARHALPHQAPGNVPESRWIKPRK